LSPKIDACCNPGFEFLRIRRQKKRSKIRNAEKARVLNVEREKQKKAKIKRGGGHGNHRENLAKRGKKKMWNKCAKRSSFNKEKVRGSPKEGRLIGGIKTNVHGVYKRALLLKKKKGSCSLVCFNLLICKGKKPYPGEAAENSREKITPQWKTPRNLEI